MLTTYFTRQTTQTMYYAGPAGPDLEKEDVTQALAYTAWLAHEEVHPV